MTGISNEKEIKTKARSYGTTPGPVLLLVAVIIAAGFAVGMFFGRHSGTNNGHLSVRNERYTVEIDYPQIGNRRLEKKIRKDIDREKNAFLSAAKKNRDRNTVFDFTADYSKNEFCGVLFVHTSVNSFTGSAHRDIKTASYYCALDSGREVDINYFLDGQEKLSALSVLAREGVLKQASEHLLQLKEQAAANGTAADKKCFEHFNLTSDGLVLLYPPYYFDAGIEDTIKVVIGKDALHGIIREDFIGAESGQTASETPVPETTLPPYPENHGKRDLSAFSGKKLIAFTFDDGPYTPTTNKLLDNLDRFQARVTFFVVGSRVEDYKDTLLRAYKMGNTIGNHTFNHKTLTNLSKEQVVKEIESTNDAVEKVTGERPKLMRPPGGSVSDAVKSATDMQTVLWNVDTEDWKSRNKDAVREAILRDARDGAIVLMHDLYATSVDGALEAMEKLYNEGWAFVTVDEMAQLKNYKYDKAKSVFGF